MPVEDEGSITRWINGVKGGDLAAAQPLWERYFARMVDLQTGLHRLEGDLASGEWHRRNRGLLSVHPP